MKPTAIFSDSCFPQKQAVTLWPDRLQVTGSVFLSQDYELTTPLTELSETVARSRGRGQVFHAGLFLVIIFGFVTLLVLSFAGLERAILPLELLCSTLFLLGLVLCIVFARKIEVVTFTNRQGVRLVSIFCTTKHEQQFTRFIQEVTDAIQNQSKA